MSYKACCKVDVMIGYCFYNSISFGKVVADEIQIRPRIFKRIVHVNYMTARCVGSNKSIVDKQYMAFCIKNSKRHAMVAYNNIFLEGNWRAVAELFCNNYFFRMIKN